MLSIISQLIVSSLRRIINSSCVDSCYWNVFPISTLQKWHSTLFTYICISNHGIGTHTLIRNLLELDSIVLEPKMDFRASKDMNPASPPLLKIIDSNSRSTAIPDIPYNVPLATSLISLQKYYEDMRVCIYLKMQDSMQQILW